MKTVDDNKIRRAHRLVLLAALLTGILTACAPPPAGNPSLQNELKLLRQQQQEQEQSMRLLQQQLVQLQQQLQIPSTVAIETADEPGIPEQQTDNLRSSETEEVKIIVAAATSYLEAFSALAMGHYQQAQDGFNSFLSEYNEHHYAPNARYWLAETEIALGQSRQAEENLLLVANNRENVSKAPAALLRLAQLYQQQDLNDQADDILHQLRTRFPESREAQQL